MIKMSNDKYYKRGKSQSSIFQKNFQTNLAIKKFINNYAMKPSKGYLDITMDVINIAMLIIKCGNVQLCSIQSIPMYFSNFKLNLCRYCAHIETIKKDLWSHINDCVLRKQRIIEVLHLKKKDLLFIRVAEWHNQERAFSWPTTRKFHN